MNCNLTNEDRKKGMRCRSWDCADCLEFNMTTNDVSIIRAHMQNMDLRKQLAQKDAEIDLLKATLKARNLPPMFKNPEIEKLRSLIERAKPWVLERKYARALDKKDYNEELEWQSDAENEGVK